MSDVFLKRDFFMAEITTVLTNASGDIFICDS